MCKKIICLVLIISFLLVDGACIKKSSKSDIERGLKAAMARSLNSGPGIDTSIVKFTVLDVAYFEEKTTYACEFKVNMKTSKIDTTGMMSANISKDFEKILRKN